MTVRKMSPTVKVGVRLRKYLQSAAPVQLLIFFQDLTFYKCGLALTRGCPSYVV
jgi:hypothetical protein